MKLSSDIPVSSPFIFADKGDGLLSLRSTRESILRLAAVVLHFHKICADYENQPLQFAADHTMAPELIAACWRVGVPFRVVPVHDAAQAGSEPIAAFQPVDYQWQEAIQLYLKDNGAGFDHGCLPSSIPDQKVFSYIFTSGSTGAPKLVGLKRAQMLEAARNAAENARPANDESWLLCLPLNHIGGASVVLRSWIYGNSVVDGRNSTPEMLSAQLKTNESLTFASVVPTQLIRIMKDGVDHPVHASFKMMLLGGGPSADSLVTEARSKNIPLVKSYGMTETCAQIAAVPATEVKNYPASSSGRIFPNHRISVRGASGKEVDTGESGLIWLKGPQIITEYLHHPDPESAFDSEGWFCTGDYGRVESDGWLFIEMRRSDLIVSGGENINPLEVEAFIRETFPNATDVAVLGLPDETWGQKMVAWIAAEPSDSFNPSAVISTLKKSLPSFKVPKDVHIVHKLPRNNMGKLLRNELKKS